MSKPVFISYSTDDAPSAAAIRNGLEAAGIACWMAPRDIAPGADYAEQILAAIEACAVMVLVLSETSNQSRYVRNEVERAIAKDKAIIPVRIHNVAPSGSLEFFVSNAQWIDAWQQPLASAIDTLAVAIRKHFGEQDGGKPGLQVAAPQQALTRPPAPVIRTGPGMAAATPNRMHNLPAALTSFIGRAGDIDDVLAQVRARRLVTLTGAGGIGKTRVAIEVATRLLDHFDQGVWFVELAPLADPGLVPQAVLSAIGVRDQSGSEPLDILVEFARDKRMLIILDSCEHLVDASAKVASAVLGAAPNVKILASSREALGVNGELTYPVLSLSLPDPRHLPALDRLAQFEAVRLFIDRARLVAAHFALDKDNAPHIAEICHRLDGIPLAIELAAARVRMMSVAQIAARLDDSFRLLTGGARTALPRQQTLRALIDWSYDLLTHSEGLLLRRLSVFAGGWTLEAAEAVCAGEGIPPHEVLDLLTQLVNKSLVVVLEHAQSEETRYRMLETIREYAREKSLEGGEQAETRRRHADYFHSLAQRMGQVADTPRELEWMRKLEPERDNLRAVNAWASENNEAEFALRLNASLFAFWLYRSSSAEASHWLESALDIKVAQESNDLRPAVAAALNVAGHAILIQGDYARAQSRFERQLAILTDIGDQRGMSLALRGCGLTAMLLGNAPHAQWCGEQALVLAREAGDVPGAAWSLFRLGENALVRGDLADAQAMLEELLPQLLELGISYAAFRTYLDLGHVMRARGDEDRARGYYQSGLQVQRSMRYLMFFADGLEGLAGIAARAGKPARAARLLGAAHTHRETTGIPRWHHQTAGYERDVAFARNQMDAEAWNAAWAAGCALSMEQAAEYALETS